MDERKINKRGYYSEIVTGADEDSGKPKVVLLTTAPRRVKLSWQISTEHHSAIVKEFHLEKTCNYLGEAKRWMTFPEDRSVAFPVSTFAPKVQLQEEARPKQLPRNVEMERKRRLYKNMKQEDILKEEGVSQEDIIPPEVILPFLSQEEKYGLFATAHFLALEIFDDEEYDCRTPADWINLGIIDGVRHPLPAKVFVECADRESLKFDQPGVSSKSLFSWYNAAVIDYDINRKLWSILTLDGTKRTYALPRIYIRFYAEDPTMYARRVSAAVEGRGNAEACIKYFDSRRFLRYKDTFIFYRTRIYGGQRVP